MDWDPASLDGNPAALARAAAAAGLAVTGYFVLAFISPAGLGLGDVKMVACMGAFLGLGPALMALIVGSVLGSVTGVLYIWLTEKDAASYELPFGSFLGIGGLAMAVSEFWR